MPARIRGPRGAGFRGLSSLLIALVLGGGAAACSGGATAPVRDANVSGTWHFSTTVTDTFSLAHTTCTLTGNLAFSQTGPFFSGTVSGSSRVCVGPFATVGSFDGPVVDGRVAGLDVGYRMTALPCHFGGTATSTSPTTLTGYAACQLPRDTSSTTFNGPLTLTR